MTNLISNEADFNLECHLNFAFHFFLTVNCEKQMYQRHLILMVLVKLNL